MTINVVLTTSDAVILGCDSTASRSQPFINPFSFGPLNPSQNGKFTIEFDASDVNHIVTDAWGGVTKMFALVETETCCVAAVTAGLANLNQRSIARLASEFRSAHGVTTAKGTKGGNGGRTVERVAKDFLAFMRKHYDAHYAAETDLPEQWREGPEFLIGGFGSGEQFPSCYRVFVQENEVMPQHVNGTPGVAWNGQADAVERIIRGYDRNLKSLIEKSFEDTLKTYQDDMNSAVVRIVDDILTKLGVPMPAGVDTTLPSTAASAAPWDDLKAAISFGSLPHQEAINFVSYLILMQAGKSRFASGIATVGGRTHIGIITREEGFKKLNEPELSHEHTGYSDAYQL
jgi:hypothetical protein